MKIKTKISIFFLSVISCGLSAQNVQTVKTYYDPYTKVHLKEVYVIDASTTAKNGSYKKYDENGIIYWEGNYKNGKENGVFKYYQCMSGVLSQTVTYKEGVKNGVEEEYACKTDQTGKKLLTNYKKRSTTYSDGSFVKETTYFESGKIKSTVQNNGLCTVLFENGKKNEEYTNKNGVKDSVCNIWFENGNAKEKKEFKDGELLNSISYSVDGKILSKTDGKSSIIFEYFQNSDKIKSELETKDNYNFIKTIYDSLTNSKTDIYYGRLDNNGKYFQAKGKHIGYYSNGNKKIEESLKYNEYSQKNELDKGILKEWYESGQIKSKVYIPAKTGNTLLYFNKNGSLDSLVLYTEKEVTEGAYRKTTKKFATQLNNSYIETNYTADDYNNLAFDNLIENEIDCANALCKLGLKKDGTNLFLLLNSAHILLLNNKYDEAIEIYKANNGKSLNNEMTWKQAIISDFDEFKKYGITNEYFERVLAEINK